MYNKDIGKWIEIGKCIAEGFEKGLEDGASIPLIIDIDLSLKEKLISPPSK